jgi:hypothetical protein
MCGELEMYSVWKIEEKQSSSLKILSSQKRGGYRVIPLNSS